MEFDKKNDAELREIWPLKKEDYVMARCSSLKCQMALNPAFDCFVAFFLSFPNANQMLLCFVQATQTHCILHLSAEG